MQLKPDAGLRTLALTNLFGNRNGLLFVSEKTLHRHLPCCFGSPVGYLDFSQYPVICNLCGGGNLKGDLAGGSRGQLTCTEDQTKNYAKENISQHMDKANQAELMVIK